MTTLNKKIREIVETGTYYNHPYNESTSDTQENMAVNQYTYSVTTADNMFNFIHKTGSFDMELKEFDWKILWDKLGNVPIDENDCIETDFECFDAGTEKIEIWHWFEWFFNIQLGGNVV